LGISGSAFGDAGGSLLDERLLRGGIFGERRVEVCEPILSHCEWGLKSELSLHVRKNETLLMYAIARASSFLEAICARAQS
jgi:hypothetical protein